MSERTKLTVRFSGENADDAKAVSEMLLALDDLFSAVGKAQGVPDAHLKLAAFFRVCDGCDQKQPEEHADWCKGGGLDFCPTCQSNGRMDEVLGGPADSLDGKGSGA